VKDKPVAAWSGSSDDEIRLVVMKHVYIVIITGQLAVQCSIRNVCEP